MLIAGNILQDRYQLQKKLGRTAAGRQTWLSTDLQTQEQVTVKLLAFSPQMEWEELKLFEREAEVLQSLNYPRIPRYRDYFSLDRETGGGLPWFGLVQDYIPGYSLQELIEKGKRFKETQVKKIAKEVLEILIYLHQLSPPVLHRDIKPSNLIYGKDKKIYLIDFGAVQAQANITGVTFTVVGTSGYAPLEQFWGRAVMASDLYALGTTLIHLATGILPIDLPQKESRLQFSDRVNLHPRLIHWLENMTEIAVEKRFQTAISALEVLESKQVIATPHPELTSLKIPQPSYSKIRLQKSAEELNIYFPSKGLFRLFDPEFGPLVVNYLSWLFIIILILFQIHTLTGVILSLVTFLVFLILLMTERISVKFINNNFEVKYVYWGLEIMQASGKSSDIAGVFMQQKTDKKYATVIRHARQTHRIGRDIREEECLWLTQEVQDWLNGYK